MTGNGQPRDRLVSVYSAYPVRGGVSVNIVGSVSVDDSASYGVTERQLAASQRVSNLAHGVRVHLHPTHTHTHTHTDRYD